MSPREQNLPRLRSTEQSEIVLTVLIFHQLKFSWEATFSDCKERLANCESRKQRKCVWSVTISLCDCYTMPSLSSLIFLFGIHFKKKKILFSDLCLFCHSHCLYPAYRFHRGSFLYPTPSLKQYIYMYMEEPPLLLATNKDNWLLPISKHVSPSVIVYMLS